MEPDFWTLLFGAALAAIGGLFTQLVLNYKTKKDAKKTLLIALTSELHVMRSDFNTHIRGIRLTLQNEEQLPRPDAFSTSTVVFDANAGSLGELGDPDLVENVVEVYSTVHHLRDEANRFRTMSNDMLQRPEVEVHHAMATMAQLTVMKLHNRLSRGENSGPHNTHNTEEETRKLAVMWYERMIPDGAIVDFSYPLPSPSNPSSN